MFSYILIFFPRLPFFSIFASSCIMDRFDKTVTVQTPPELRRFTQASVLPSILDKMGKDAVNSIQFLPGGSFRASCCAMDIWRDLHPLTPGFTWESPDHALASRIVLIGCPAVCAPFVSFCNFVPCPFPTTRSFISPSVPLSSSHVDQAGGNATFPFWRIRS